MIIISYGVFNLRNENIYEDVISYYKCYNVRPLAFFTDAYVFSWFWDNMYALLLIMLILHVLNLYLLYKICEKIDIKLNAFCMILFAFAPLLIEALYWISASTRIVFSLFLCLASIYLLLNSFGETKTVRKLTMFFSAIILNLLCVGYYEQTIALNLFLFSFVMICLKKYRYIFIPITSTIWIGIWYIYFMINGRMQARGALNLTGIVESVKVCIKMVIDKFEIAYNNFINSLGFGTDIVLNSAISIILLAIISVTIVYIYWNNCTKDENKKNFRKVFLGGIIFISPILPFVILETNYIAMRNLYLPFLGVAILLEVLFDLVLKLIKNNRAHNIIKTTVCGFFMIIFVIANVDGTSNYKKINAIDFKAFNQVLKNVDKSYFEEQKTISINYDIDELNKYKNLSNNMECTIESDWASMGKIQVLSESKEIGNVYINSKQEEADYTFYFDKDLNLVK